MNQFTYDIVVLLAFVSGLAAFGFFLVQMFIVGPRVDALLEKQKKKES